MAIKKIPGLKRMSFALVNVVCDDGSVSHRIFVTDRSSRISFLVDTAADLCVYPGNRLRGSANRNEYVRGQRDTHRDVPEPVSST